MLSLVSIDNSEGKTNTIFSDTFLLNTFKATLNDCNIDPETYRYALDLFIKSLNSGLSSEEDRFALNFILDEINFWHRFKLIVGSSSAQINFQKSFYANNIMKKIEK